MPALLKKCAQPKTNYYGIEVTDRLVWDIWEPGREYTKNIVLKNLKIKLEKVKFSKPTSRFFNTIYPQPIMLTQGTTFSLPITFRPLEKIEYNDEIEFFTTEGKFVISISAVLPKFELQTKRRIDFGMCAAHYFAQATFEIENCSELATPFYIECLEPYSVHPSEGVVSPFDAVTITCNFRPTAALVYDAVAIIKYGKELGKCLKIKITGIGKYPHLMVTPTSLSNHDRPPNENLVDFGVSAVGETVEKLVEIKNLSLVNTPYTITHPAGTERLDCVFKCKQMKGIINAGCAVEIPIVFKPNTVGIKSVDYFHVKAIGDVSQSVICCSGSSQGPRVGLSDNVLNFKVIDQGETAVRTIDIINDMTIPATFQILTDCHESVFKFELLCGTLPPQTRKTILVHFAPILPINYYRRITCMVHNQGPLFLDLIGTCHTELVKPAVLQPKHLYLYDVHKQRSLTYTPPDVLNEMLAGGSIEVDEEGYLFDPHVDQQEHSNVILNHPSMDQFFNDGHHADMAEMPHVSLDTNFVDFGQCPTIHHIEEKTVIITNHTSGKVSAAWMSDNNRVFSVSPNVRDLLPQTSGVFTVNFRPNGPNQFFGAQLECFVYYKSLRDYRLVEDLTQFPPWCLTLDCFGQTFHPSMETFLPRCNVDSMRTLFLPVSINESTFRTMLLTNIGHTPIFYKIDCPEDSSFAAKPRLALVEPNKNHVVVFKHRPTQIVNYEADIPLLMNDMDKNTLMLRLVGSAEDPRVELENDGNLFFSKTCVGLRQERLFGVKNVTRMPMQFEWRMKASDKKHIYVFPKSGVIQPNEMQYHTWTFQPANEAKLVLKPVLVLTNSSQSEAHVHGAEDQEAVRYRGEATLRVVAEGAVGGLCAMSNYLDLGPVVVGSHVYEEIMLVNNNNCALYYSLQVEQLIKGPYTEEEVAGDPLALEMEKVQGMIPARSKAVIKITVLPVRRVYYQWSVSYKLTKESGEPNRMLDFGPHHLCHILANGVYPTVAVTDARCYGSVIGLSKKQLWKLFNLDMLNVSLDSDPSPAELVYNLQTRHSHNRRPPVYTRAIMDFNFSGAPVNAEPSCVQLMLENTGNVECEWAFLMPRELELELEYWSETGEFTESELHEMKVQDNHLFTVSPSKGKLQPGDLVGVTFTYIHQAAGTDRLPVLLKVAQGREILLNFVGVTVACNHPYIHFPMSKHLFAPVPIGSKNVATQLYEMYNAGGMDVEYQLDLSPLQQLVEENYDHRVFEVLNPTGTIHPGQTGYVEWKFDPLEAKTYMVDIPIHLSKKETAMITFTGVGYDRRLMGDTMPIVDQPHELAGVPSVQTLLLPKQLCMIVPERITFGNVPLFTKNRRITTVVNKSMEHSVHFRWHLTAAKDSQMISVTPCEGIVEPGEASICRITMTALGTPAFFDIDLMCELTNMTEYKQYKKELEEWKAERVRQSVEFCITEDNMDADEKLLDLDSHRPPSRLATVSSSRRTSPDLEDIKNEAQMIKYKTLPPIKPCLMKKNETQVLRGKHRFKEAFWPRPEPPSPFLLHFGVTARSHTIADYQQNFEGELKGFFIDKLLSERQGNIESSNAIQKAKPVKCFNREADLVKSMLMVILRGLIEDTEFQESCSKVLTSPIPYYVQYASSPLPRGRFGNYPTSAVERTSRGDRRHTFAGSTDNTPPAMPPRTNTVPGSSRTPNTTNPQILIGDKTDTMSIASIDSDGASTLSSVMDEGAEKMMTSTPKHSALTKSMKKKREEEEEQTRKFQQKQIMKKLPEFGNVVDSVIENTVLNIVREAFHLEFNITNRPRQVALPPKSRASSRGN